MQRDGVCTMSLHGTIKKKSRRTSFTMSFYYAIIEVDDVTAGANSYFLGLLLQY